MKKMLIGFAAAAALSAGLPAAFAEDAAPFTEGAVVELSYIKIRPGMMDAYMKYLDTTYKQLMDEEKKEGIILDYAVYAANPRNPGEPDLVLSVTYKNMAALDGLEERSEAVNRKVWSTRDAANKADVARGAMREVLGSEYIRELKLK